MKFLCDKFQINYVQGGWDGDTNPHTGEPWDVGDKFRLAFITKSTTTAESKDYRTYDKFALQEAQLSTLAYSRMSYSVTGDWRAHVYVYNEDGTISSPRVRMDTEDSDLSVPIYAMDGTLLAAGYTELYNGPGPILDQNSESRHPGAWTTGSGTVDDPLGHPKMAASGFTTPIYVISSVLTMNVPSEHVHNYFDTRIKQLVDSVTVLKTDMQKVLDTRNEGDALLDQKLTGLTDDVEQNRSGIAMAAGINHPTVLAGMTQALDLSAINYEGKTGLAINYSRRINDNVQINFGSASTSDYNESVIKGGIVVQW